MQWYDDGELLHIRKTETIENNHHDSLKPPINSRFTRGSQSQSKYIEIIQWISDMNNAMSLNNSWLIFLHSCHGDWGTYNTAGRLFLTAVQTSHCPVLWTHSFIAVSTSSSVLKTTLQEKEHNTEYSIPLVVNTENIFQYLLKYVYKRMCSPSCNVIVCIV